MWNWLKEKLGLARSEPIHPPWREGQYVTYFLDGEDGYWAALALQVLGQTEDGAWALSGDFKTPIGEHAVLFRVDPNASSQTPDLLPVRQMPGRRSASASDDLESVLRGPESMIAVAMNLLMVRRWPEAAKSLSNEARPVRYPCGIDQAHLLITSGPGYEKWHDLCPRVMITGVACMSGVMVTSFGCNGPAGTPSAPCEDFVDLSHLKRVDHEGFVLTYPATWFMVREPDQERDGLRISAHRARAGGFTCALICSVTFYRGDPRCVAAEHRAIQARLSEPKAESTPRAVEAFRLSGDVQGYACDYDYPDEIEGVSYSAMIGLHANDAFVRITAYGCIAKAHPNRRETMAEYERVFREVIESFELDPAMNAQSGADSAVAMRERVHVDEERQDP